MQNNFQNTSSKDGFNIFEKISGETVPCDGQHNVLNLYILKIHDKLFAYDRLYKYILDNICQYVFDRQKNSDSSQDRTLILEAIEYLREIHSNTDPGAGGELGEILLYLFLEQDLQAPKLFSKVELKTSNNQYINGVDAIHFRFRTDCNHNRILQLVIGEAKIQNSLKQAIDEALSSINDYIMNNNHEVKLLDSHLMNQLLRDDDAQTLKKYLLGEGVEEKETIFGVFIGYSVNYDGRNDNNDNYKQKIKQKNLELVQSVKNKILDKIKKYHISNHQFNFYFLPFHNAKRDRKAIMEQLTNKQHSFSWRDIKNGQ